MVDGYTMKRPRNFPLTIINDNYPFQAIVSVTVIYFGTILRIYLHECVSHRFRLANLVDGAFNCGYKKAGFDIACENTSAQFMQVELLRFYYNGLNYPLVNVL